MHTGGPDTILIRFFLKKSHPKRFCEALEQAVSHEMTYALHISYLLMTRIYNESQKIKALFERLIQFETVSGLSINTRKQEPVWKVHKYTHHCQSGRTH